MSLENYGRLCQDVYIALIALPFHFALLLAAIAGGLIGSFLNMLIWRLPRGESIVFPRSHCTVCNHVLGFSDLIPLFSYVFLRGRCAYCHTAFGPRYFFVELFCVIITMLAYYLFHWSSSFLLCVMPCYFFVLLLNILPTIIAKKKSRKGFTFVEIMFAGVIVGAIIIPFGNMFLSSYSRVLRNKQYTIAYNLLEEKMEELKLVPFARLKSDWLLYAKTENYLDSIFVDEHVGPYQKMKVDEEFFRQNFSDIYTKDHQLPESIFKRFLHIYQSYYGFDYRIYPDDYEIYKRTVQIEPVPRQKKPKFDRITAADFEENLLKITVTIWIDSNILHRKLELSAYRKR